MCPLREHEVPPAPDAGTSRASRASWRAAEMGEHADPRPKRDDPAESRKRGARPL
jgi:hypothetical protein